jgi:hypothetical protein
LLKKLCRVHWIRLMTFLKKTSVMPNQSLNFLKKILLSGKKKKVAKAITISEHDHYKSGRMPNFS